jgi:hypothetical protein
MSVALFCSTLRTAIRDALAVEAAGAPTRTLRAEPSSLLIEARPIEARPVRRLALIVHESLSAKGHAS